jgi:hypothetical protein
VITAAENYVIMAEDLDGNVDISDVVSPNSNSSNAEKAWHFFLPSLTSGYMYYGKSLDMEVKQTIAGNNAIEFAQNEINNHSGVDNTAPSVFIPQRFPYNPGGKGFGPIYGYKEFQNSSDFHVWTFAYDVSGLQSVVLKYRTDNDGSNPLTDNENEVYADGSGVSSWNSVTMTQKTFPKDNVTNDPEIDLFILPTAIADLCYAEISGLSNTLVDYYVEATDSKGNVFKTPIQHVYVGEYHSNDVVTLNIDPTSGNYSTAVTVSMDAATTATGANIAIYYTTDGTDPDSTSSMYSGEFEVGDDGNSVTIKAIAYDSEGNKSDIVSRSYSFGTIESFDIHFKNTSNWNDVYVYLYDKNSNSALPGWSWPGVSMTKEGDSPWYAYTVNESIEVGIVFNNNNNGQQTDNLFRTIDGWYDYSNNTWYDQCPGDCPGTVNPPVLSVDQTGDTYQNSVTVTLSATNGGAIYYTTDGSAPTELGTSYTNPITFDVGTHHLKAKSFNSGGESNLIDETYIVEETGCFTVYFRNTDNWSSVKIYLWDKNANASLSGWSWPGVDMTPIEGTDWYSYEICESVDVGIIFTNGSGAQTGDLSRTTDGWFEWSTKQWTSSCPGGCPITDPVPVLSVDPVGGTFTTSVSVTLSATYEGVIHYTTDGLAPNSTSPTYTSALEFTETTRLRAIAYNTNGSSNEIDETYTKETIPAGLTVHFKKPSNWANAYIYYWNTSPVSLSVNWPGVALEYEGDGWYKYIIEGVECANIIFNNQGQPQTADLNNICEESWYDNGWVADPGLKSALALDVENISNEVFSSLPYPNPFKNKISFDISERSDLHIEITDVKGSVVFQEEMKNCAGKVELTIDIPKGIYMMKCLINSKLNTYKIIKE